VKKNNPAKLVILAKSDSCRRRFYLVIGIVFNCMRYRYTYLVTRHKKLTAWDTVVKNITRQNRPSLNVTDYVFNRRLWSALYLRKNASWWSSFTTNSFMNIVNDMHCG